MSGKKFKAIRKAYIPGREETGISRGAFIRALTQYDKTNRKGFTYQYTDPETEDFSWETYTAVLDKNCPKGLYKTVKRRNK